MQIEGSRWHRPLLGFSAVMGVLVLVSVAGLLLDGRTVVGSPAWLKPCKFSVSMGVYGLSLAWLLGSTRRAPRTGWWAGTAVAFAGTAEMVAIVLQAARGHASHFNTANSFDETVWMLMGNMVVVLWTASAVVAVVVALQRGGDPVVRSAARLGFVLSLAGMLLGFLMTAPTAEQERTLDAGGSLAMTGGHSVGVPDGGPAMPVTGWSTTGGDLRIPHFVGLHALQMLPLLALLLAVLTRRGPLTARLAPAATRRRLVRVAAAGYGALVAVLTWQALRGEPLTHPSAPVLLTAGALLVAVLAAAAAVLAVRPVTGPVPVPVPLVTAA